MQFTTFLLPTWTIAPLFNDDYSALNDSEVKELSDFLHSDFTDGKIGLAVSVPDEPYFAHTNDLNNMGGDVCNITFEWIPN